MTRTDRRPAGPQGARRRGGVAAAGAEHALHAGGRHGGLPAAGEPRERAPLARGVFWRTSRTRAAAVLTALTAGLALPVLPVGVAHAVPSVEAAQLTAVYVVRAEAGKLSGAVTAVEAVGGTVQATLPLVNSVVARVPVAAVGTLVASAAVASATPDQKVELAPSEPAYDPSTDPYSLRRGQANSGVTQAWAAGATGEGVRVAVIDSGITPVRGLDGKGKVTHAMDMSFDVVDAAKRHKDGYGHGTHLGGIIAGDDAATVKGKKRTDGTSFTGVAPGAELVAVKIGDSEGRVDVSQVLAALDFLVATKDQSRVRVVNLSFNAGGLQSYTLDPLSFAVERAWKAGLVVVVSAGNDGDALGRLQNPAQNPYVLAVGAVDDKGTLSRDDDVVPDFSAEGDGIRNPDVVAPGRSMQSLAAPASYAAKHAKKAGDRFLRASGTSQAAAFVSGAAALLLGERPELTPDQVKHLLTSTAQALPGTPASRQGNGAIDVAAALAAGTPGAEAVQAHVPSTGLGSLDASRGERRLVIDGELLTGEKDVWGGSFDAASVAGSLVGDAKGVLEDGSLSGATWSGATWSGATWSGATWSGATWSGATWSGATWSGATWSGATWSGATWSGATWSGANWSGATWSGATWR